MISNESMIDAPVASSLPAVGYRLNSENCGNIANFSTFLPGEISKYYSESPFPPPGGADSAVFPASWISLALMVLLGMMLYYGMLPTINALWLPAFCLLALVISLGVGL